MVVIRSVYTSLDICWCFFNLSPKVKEIKSILFGMIDVIFRKKKDLFFKFYFGVW